MASLQAPSTAPTGVRGTTRATTGKLELDYDVTPLSVRIARTIVTAHLRLWGLECLIDPGALAISELMTNVLDHTRPDSEGRRTARVTVTRMPNGVALCVHDSDPALRPQRYAGDDDEGGRGLRVLRAVADKFGVSRPPSGGKNVWLTLQKPRDVRTA